MGNNPVNYVDPTGHFAETVLDILSIGWSTIDLIRNPSWANLGWLLADVGGALIPFIPSSGVVRHGAKLITKASGIAADAIKQYDLVTYGVKVAKGFEKHHGVLDVWATANIKGYKTRNAAAPTIVLSKEAHEATKRVFNDWRKVKTGSITGTIDWSKISGQEILDLSERMFDSAGVPAEVRKAYYEAFAEYVHGLSK